MNTSIWTYGKPTAYSMPIAELIKNYEEFLEPDAAADISDYNYFYRQKRYSIDRGFLYQPITPETHKICDEYAKELMAACEQTVKDRVAELKAAQESGVTMVALSSFEYRTFCEVDEEDDEDE